MTWQWQYVCPMGSADELRNRGPLLVGKLGADRQIQALAAHRALETLAVEAHFMIDTGAHHSMVSLAAARHLSLRSIGSMPIRGISGVTHRYTVFAATLEIPMERASGGSAMVPVPIALAGLDSHPADEHHGLIGRDFLRAFEFMYEGPTGRFTLRTDRNWPR